MTKRVLNLDGELTLNCGSIASGGLDHMLRRAFDEGYKVVSNGIKQVQKPDERWVSTRDSTEVKSVLVLKKDEEHYALVEGPQGFYSLFEYNFTL